MKNPLTIISHGLAMLGFLATTAPNADAETVVTHEQTIERGKASEVELHMVGDDVFVAVQGGSGGLVMLRMEPGSDNSLSVRQRVGGTQTRGQDIVTTLWGTIVTATLEPDEVTGDAGGALTLDTFVLTDDGILQQSRHRADPRPPVVVGFAPGQAPQPGIGAVGPQFAPDPPQQDAIGIVINPGFEPPAGGGDALVDIAPPGSQDPALHAHAVAIEDVSIFTGDGGMGRERVAVAILDEESRLRLETFQLDGDHILTRIASNHEAGRASLLTTTTWTGGIITAVRDSVGNARLIVWRILTGGGIERASTANLGAATDIDIANFDGENQFVVAWRQDDGQQLTALVEVNSDGSSQRILARGTGPKVKSVSVTAGAAPSDEIDGPGVFYVATKTQDNFLSVTRWRRENNSLLPGAARTIDVEVGEVTAALTPFFADFPDGTDTIVTASTDADGELQIDVFRSFFRDLNASEDFAIESRSLVFSRNSTAHQFDGQDYPADMPETKMPRLRNCDTEEALIVRRAWRRAHYSYWRADQVMGWLKENGGHRAAAWLFEYDENFDGPNGFTNYGPRGWFGSYDGDRFHDIMRSIDKIERDRFRERDFVVICRQTPTAAGGHSCFTMGIGGQHAVLGRISVCDRLFEEGRSTTRNARLIAHEIAHWVKIPKSIFWLTDNHDYWEGQGRCVLDYKAVRPLYGDLAAHIANVRGCRGKNYERAARNIDNYAHFVTRLGREIYSGRLTEFPRQSFWTP